MEDSSKPKGFLPENLGTWVDIVAKVGAIFVVIFGVVEYLEAQRSARVTRTQEFMTRYSSQPVLRARTAVSSVLRDNLPTIQDIRSVALNPSAASQAHKDLVQFLVSESRGGTGLASEIDSLVDFYGMLEVCVEEGVCERSVAVAYFSTDAKRLLENFRPYVEDRRVLAPDYGLAAERLIGPRAGYKP